MSGVLLSPNQVLVRAPVNPLDKSTVVSIYPLVVKVNNITLTPGEFHIAPGSFEKPSVLTIGSSSWWREVDENQPALEIPVSSVLVADSIVRDYTIGMLLCDMETRKPGLFFVPGEHSSEDIKKNHSKELELARKRQTEWFRALVNVADSLWARTQGNPLAIDNLMRVAARELGLDKEWIRNFIPSATLVACPACTTLINSLAVVCPNCRVVINKDKFEKSGMRFAG